MRSPRGNLRKKYTILGGVLLFLYLYIASGFNKHSQLGVIENSEPEAVWLFLSDFSQLKTINPAIQDFTITADHGNRDHWKYSVHFTERMLSWPRLQNLVQSHISVKTLGSQNYLIESETKSCYFGGIYCVNSVAEIELSQAKTAPRATNYKETVRYQCPPFVGFICKREMANQREIVFQNLRQHFNALT